MECVVRCVWIAKGLNPWCGLDVEQCWESSNIPSSYHCGLAVVPVPGAFLVFASTIRNHYCHLLWNVPIEYPSLDSLRASSTKWVEKTQRSQFPLCLRDWHHVLVGR